MYIKPELPQMSVPEGKPVMILPVAKHTAGQEQASKTVRNLLI
jgi:hypothetical protein